jgi:aminoglycoside phosphotransferase (APT) family kinase protein
MSLNRFPFRIQKKRKNHALSSQRATLQEGMLINIGSLGAWLEEHVPQLGSGPVTCVATGDIPGKLTYSIVRGDQRCILRMGSSGDGKGLMRQVRVLSALDGTDVPHFSCLGSCTDDYVIGAPFYVTEALPGWSGELRDGRIHHRPPFDDLPYGPGLAFAIAGGLINLANTDYKAIGLEDFGRADSFLERQVDRWQDQLASYPAVYGVAGRDLPGLDLVTAWLRGNRPADSRPGLMHGDVGTPNAVFAMDPPARLLAFTNWDLAAIGDPYLDLGWFGSQLRDDRASQADATGVMAGVAGWPTRQELARHYAENTGRAYDDLDYYLVLAMFKSAALLERFVAQAAAGKAPKAMGEMFAQLVLDSMANAVQVVKWQG